MIGTLYGVGVGPGDKKLLTIQAVEVLRSVDKIIVPDTGGENIALSIVLDYIEQKEKIYCKMPMTRDTQLLEESHNICADQIAKELEQGTNLAFITLGDPTIYSTYMYIHRLILSRGYQPQIINGIPSFCAAAAKLNISLCDGPDALHIIPASYAGTEEFLKLQGNKVLMKNGKSILQVKEHLKQLGMLQQAQMVECCTMENEKVYKKLSDITEDNSYFSIIIVKGE